MGAEGSEGGQAGSPSITDELFRQLVESISAVTYVLRFGHADEPPIYMSPQCDRVLGLPRETLMVDAAGRNKLLHLDDRARVWEHAIQIDATGGDWEEEYRLKMPDGAFKWVHDQARIVRRRDGEQALWFGVLTDLTRTNEAELALASSQARYQALVDRIPAYVYIASDDPDPVMTYVSPQALEMMGFAPDEWMADQDLWLKTMHPEDRATVKAAWESAVERRGTFVSEYRAIRQDGREIWLRDVARRIHEADGEGLFWQGLVQDITESKRAEHELRESDVRYRTLVEQVPAVVYVDSNDEHPMSLYVSPQAFEILGHAPQEYLDNLDFWQQTMHPDDWERVQARWAISVRTGEPFRDTYRYVRPDGDVVWVIDDSRLVRADDGTPMFWQGVLQDITVGKRAEEELRASEARFRALVERSPAVVYEVGMDDERRTLYVSPQVETLFGYSRQEWLDQPDIWTELLHPDDREIVLAAHDLHNETRAPWRQEYRLIASDGRAVWVRDQAELIRDESGDGSTWQGIMLDITALKELEEQLRLSNEELELYVIDRTTALAEANEMMTLEIGERLRVEAELRSTQERYRQLVEEIPAVAYVRRLGDQGDDGAENYTSPQIERLLGFAVEEWNDTDLWHQRLHPHDRERMLAAAARSAETGSPFAEEYRLLAKAGHVVWVADHSALLSRDTHGKPHLFQGVLLDISARKEAEALEEQFRELLDSSPAVTYVFETIPGEDPPMRFLHVSRQISQLVGETVQTLVSDLAVWLNHIHPDDRQRVQQESSRSRETGRPWQRTFRVIARDGRVLSVLSVGRCVQRDADGTPRRFVGALIDVTASTIERDRLEAERAQLRSLVDGLPGFSWTTVVEGEPGTGQLTFIGSRVEEILGYTAEELLSTPGSFDTLVHPDDRNRIDALAVHHDLTEEPWRAEFRARARDGNTRWLRSQGLASRDEKGRLVWNGITFDITDERTSDETITVVPDTTQIGS